MGEEERAPGSASRANARISGRARFSDPSAGRPTWNTSRSSGIAIRRLSSWRAKPDTVSLRSETSSSSTPSFLDRAPNTRPWPLRTRVRSCGCSPRVASLTCEVFLYASSQWEMASLKPLAPSRLSELEYSRRKVRRFSLVSFCSEVSSSPNCTGEAVWLGPMVPPLGRFGAVGVPGRTSTK